ncbi:uncharacterized protein bonsai isoform X2 [Dermacentor albipictus]|uniref:uncharacterized protein bonsai isoform X2 n=1 Tax=Dermacentor albipictus TaxID=60249 RepID=UPI0038FD08B8
MNSFARLSCSVSTVRVLFIKLSVTETITKTTTAGFHSAATKDVNKPRALLGNRAHLGSANHVSRRFRNRKILSWPTDYLPFEWSYPAPTDVIARSGDLVSDTGPTDPTMPFSGFELSDELKTASLEVKRVFSLQLANMRRELKDALAKAIEKRNKALKYLYRYDRERFLFVTHTLHITYTPAQLHHITLPVTKKGDLRRLTAEYCERIKQDKMNAFHEKLVAEQVAFLEEKCRAEEWIHAEGERLGLSEDERESTKYVGILDKVKHTE